jgi:hypothetical protein
MLPLVVMLPVPVEIATSPPDKGVPAPAHFVCDPAVKIKSPLLSGLATVPFPPERTILPECPAAAFPDINVKDPEVPELVVPDAKCREPLTPSVPALSEVTRIDPEEDFVDLPVASRTAAPVAKLLSPARKVA